MNKHFRLSGRYALKLEECGLSPADVLRSAGLPAGLFAETRILLNTEQFFAFWKAVGEVSRDHAIGLRLGTEHRTERFHPSGLAALSTENLRAAAEHMARYKQLTCPEELLLSTQGDEFNLRFRWLMATTPEPPVLAEYCFAWIQTIARHGTGQAVSPIRVELIHSVQSASHRRALEQHFDCPVITSAETNTIVFRTQDALRPFRTRNAELLEILAPQFDQELRQQDIEESFVDRVRSTIQQRLTGRRPVIDDIARDLHMSGRTLQRRLQDEGSSYQRVLDAARHQMARYYLGQSVLELNEAAYLLGYEDANSFVRAFRTWEGIPPGAWRESQRANATVN